MSLNIQQLLGASQFIGAEEKENLFSLDFPGSTHRVNVGNIGGVFGGDFSVCLWLKAPGFSGFRTLVDKRAATSSGFLFALSSANLFLRLNGNDTTLTAGLTTNAWHFVAVTRSETTGKMYVDSGQIGDAFSAPEDASNAVDATFGFNLTNSLPYTGLLDDIRIWSQALTSNQIQDVRNFETISTNLVGHWKFDEGSGCTTADASGNGNTGTLGPDCPTDSPEWSSDTAPLPS